MIILDSTALIDALKGNKECIAKIKELEKDNELATTEVSTYEVLFGAYYNKNNQEERIKVTEAYLSNFILFKLDHESAKKAAEIGANLTQKGKKIDDNDCLIAGIALINGATAVLTKNREHFSRIQNLQVISY